MTLFQVIQRHILVVTADGRGIETSRSELSTATESQLTRLYGMNDISNAWYSIGRIRMYSVCTSVILCIYSSLYWRRSFHVIHSCISSVYLMFLRFV